MLWILTSLYNPSFLSVQMVRQPNAFPPAGVDLFTAQIINSGSVGIPAWWLLVIVIALGLMRAWQTAPTVESLGSHGSHELQAFRRTLY
jgi:hypothetical protein